MAVACEFIDVIVPIERIDAVYPGGFAAFKSQNADLVHGRFWHDSHLFRDGVMSPQDVSCVVDFWEGYGLTPFGKTADGVTFWKDMCAVEAMMIGGATLPCDWIEVCSQERCAWKRGSDKGEIIGRWNQNKLDSKA